MDGVPVKMARYLWDPPQPIADHYHRNLKWVEREIWDLPLRDQNGSLLEITDKAKAFIRSLYSKTISPSEGGWKQ